MDYGKTRESDNIKMLLDQLKTTKNRKMISGLISKLNKLKKSIEAENKGRSKIGKAARNKGAVGEREWRDFLNGYNFGAKRGCQHSGGVESPDVIHDIDGYHFEVKRSESFNAYKALGQAIDDAGENVPIVAHRRNGCEWLCVVRAADLVNIIAKKEGLR